MYHLNGPAKMSVGQFVCRQLSSANLSVGQLTPTGNNLMHDVQDLFSNFVCYQNIDGIVIKQELLLWFNMQKMTDKFHLCVVFSLGSKVRIYESTHFEQIRPAIKFIVKIKKNSSLISFGILTFSIKKTTNRF